MASQCLGLSNVWVGLGLGLKIKSFTSLLNGNAISKHGDKMKPF